MQSFRPKNHIGTVGIEIETVLAGRKISNNNFNIQSDASIMTPVRSINSGLPFILSGNDTIPILSIRGRDGTIGTEFVSVIFDDFRSMRTAVSDLCEGLLSQGEPTQDNRASVHFHVGMAYTINTLKNIIRLGIRYESLLYHLGGMGYAFRGTRSNSPYCKAFTKNGPPIVRSNLGNVPMFNVPALLSAESVGSFWNRFGMYNGISNGRYTPQRYMFINLYSLELHGTLEFRMCNKTLNVDYIMAMAELSRQFSLSSLNGDYQYSNDDMFSVFDKHTTEEHHQLLDFLSRDIGGITSRNLSILHDILDISPVTTLKNVYSRSHAKRYNDLFYSMNDVAGLNYCPIDDSLINESYIEDSHAIQDRIDRALRRRGYIIDGLSGGKSLEEATSLAEKRLEEEDSRENERRSNNVNLLERMRNMVAPIPPNELHQVRVPIGIGENDDELPEEDDELDEDEEEDNEETQN